MVWLMVEQVANPCYTAVLATSKAAGHGQNRWESQLLQHRTCVHEHMSAGRFVVSAKLLYP